MKTTELKKLIADGGLDKEFAALLEIPETDKRVSAQRERFSSAVESFESIYGCDRNVALFSVPGRSEIMGNHTDHQQGRVIAASITLDCIAVASLREDSVIRIKSEGFPEDVVDIAEYNAPREERFFKSDAIIAGVADGFRKHGLKVGGYDAYTTSNVLKGSGLSSSAAFEDMVGNILSHFYNKGTVSATDIAVISQYAENVFFGKPCGLMDQMACAWGGLITIDFEDKTNPKTEGLGFDLTKKGYCLCITDTGGNHADLNADYASVPAEMKSVAKLLGHEVLCHVTYDDILKNAREIREKCGDRALLRAIHFVNETNRVSKIADSLRNDDLDAFLNGILASGDSSYKYLQNVYTVKNVEEQGLSTALAITDNYLSNKKAAWRVHGGGFAGTVQAFVPMENVNEYRAIMDSVFGEGACMELRIRSAGAIKIFE